MSIYTVMGKRLGSKEQIEFWDLETASTDDPKDPERGCQRSLEIPNRPVLRNESTVSELSLNGMQFVKTF